METHDRLVAWLSDAHALEENLEQVLTRQIAAAEAHATFRAGLEQHLEQTHRHRETIAGCLESLGAQPSALKSVAGGLIGAVEGMSTGIFRDEQLKNALADYAMEHLEIGCYSSLIAAAEEAGLEKIARACSDILREEVEMASWLEDQIPLLTRAHLHSSAA